MRTVAILLWLCTTGCTKAVTSPTETSERKDLTMPSAKLVEALVETCETPCADEARERAEAVIRSGPDALPFLLKAWKEKNDPDVVAWTHACIICLRKGMALEHYRELLAKHKKPSQELEIEDLFYLGHACILGDKEAECILALRAGNHDRGREAEYSPFAYWWLSHYLYRHYKRPRDLDALVLLESDNPVLRSDAVETLESSETVATMQSFDSVGGPGCRWIQYEQTQTGGQRHAWTRGVCGGPDGGDHAC